LFWLVWVLIADLHVMSQIIGEKNEVEGLEDQRSYKRSSIGPIRMIQGKNPQTKSAPKRSVREALGSDQAGATTARGGGHTAVLPGTHGRASPHP